MDKTHHDQSITGDNSGQHSFISQSQLSKRSPACGEILARHNGVYATTAAGETLPPLYLFYSGAKFEENFCVKCEWLLCVPEVQGKFGFPNLVKQDSFHSVCCAKGSIDYLLVTDYIEHVIFPMHPYIRKWAEFDTYVIFR